MSLLNLGKYIACKNYVTDVQPSNGRRHMATHYDFCDGQWRASRGSLKCRFHCVMFSNYISYQMKQLIFNHCLFFWIWFFRCNNIMNSGGLTWSTSSTFYYCRHCSALVSKPLLWEPSNQIWRQTVWRSIDGRVNRSGCFTEFAQILPMRADPTCHSVKCSIPVQSIPYLHAGLFSASSQVCN
jgi:hypothetical protein